MPTPLDAQALTEQLVALRELDRNVVAELSTELTMAASNMKHRPQHARGLLHAARILWTIAHEDQQRG